MSVRSGTAESWRISVGRVMDVFYGQSLEDVASALLISSLWLPNVACPVRHEFLTGVFAATDPSRFRQSGAGSYESFRTLLEQLHPLVPSFPSLEDYVPQEDWGQMRFHHEGRDFRILYGCEISDVYDYLILYQMVYASLDEVFQQMTGRSPCDELRYCLEMQDELIGSIRSQPGQTSGLAPGHFEIPPRRFWDEASAFYRNHDPETGVPQSFRAQYTLDIGSTPNRVPGRKQFLATVDAGTILPALFLRHKGRSFHILPRRWPSVLLESWGRVLMHHQRAVRLRQSLAGHVGSEVSLYLQSRLGGRAVLPLVSAVSHEDIPHEARFCAAFPSRGRLVLVDVLTPFCSGRAAAKELVDRVAKVREALELLQARPANLAMTCEGKIARFDQPQLESPLLITVLPQGSPRRQAVPIPKSLPGIVMFLDDFLAIVDEVENADEIASFAEYLATIDGKVTFPLTTVLDKYASFKSFHGVLVEGAREPNLIMLDPHWGSSMRYESLSRFWALWPQAGLFGHPRTWRAEAVSPTLVRLHPRGYFGMTLCCTLGPATVFISAPFHALTPEQVKLADLLVQALADTVVRNERTLVRHSFFRQASRLQVMFFPHGLVLSDPDLGHLRHLDPNGVCWRMDSGFLEGGLPGVRVVFDESVVAKAFQGAKDATLEIDLLLEVLTKVDSQKGDAGLPKIVAALLQRRHEMPRFKAFLEDELAAFPEGVRALQPLAFHHKAVHKRMAELAAHLDLVPGSYGAEEARDKLNTLRKAVVSEVDREVHKYNHRQGIPYLLERIDALVHDYEQMRLVVKHSLEHDVDFSREQTLAKEHRQFITHHQGYRYLIEKFVQLRPVGSHQLTDDRFQHLAALAEGLLRVYAASDAIHYRIYPATLEVDDDWAIHVTYGPDLEPMETTFGEEQAALELRPLGDANDSIQAPTPIKAYLTKLDKAFNCDLNFSLTHLINVLQVLNRWPRCCSGIVVATYYSARMEEIQAACLRVIEGIGAAEVASILDFLTLKSKEMLTVTDEVEPCDDLPVWEHRKRPARYNLRPLILTDGAYLWGPHSVRKSGIIWANLPVSGGLPADIRPSRSIQRVLDAENEATQRALEDQVLQILRRRTPCAHKRVFLDRMNKRAGHPAYLGDYDVLAYWPERNSVFNIECKDILPAYCLKDARRLRQKIFGTGSEDLGELGKVERRASYLQSHIAEVARGLGWNLRDSDTPQVISAWVSRRSYWWTRFPPRDTRVGFLRVDTLDHFLSGMSTGSS